MKILGINSVYHEKSAALIVDGRVCWAVEEERYNRIKHGSEALIDNSHELPVQSIRSCFEQGNLKPAELDAICFSFEPELRRQGWQEDPYAQPGNWGHPAGEQKFLASVQKVQDVLSELLQIDVAPRFHWVPHHLAHAASTYYPSHFDSACILVVDGIGETATALMAHGDGLQIHGVQNVLMPHSIGFLWEKFSKFLGFSEYDACKVMGLAGYGNPYTYKEHFRKFLRYDGKRDLHVDNHVMQFRQPNCDSLQELFGPIASSGAPGHSQKSRDIAATLQAETNEILLGMAKYLHSQHPCDALCLAGGVALNCTSNWVVKEQGPFQKIYIPSSPNDAGTAVGAALHYYFNQHEYGQTPGQTTHRPPSRPAAGVMPHPYTGPEFTDEQILRVLKAQRRPFRKSADVAKEAAGFIGSGKVLGWFQGSMEWGPRALGNRSLLADPRDRNMREVLNRKVKHREIFRPFAPSVLEEQASDWFELGKSSESYRYMLYACPVLKDKQDKIPAVVHIDGSARVQTVARELTPKFHQLITYFYELTGVPMVLNTSFNDSEPIVCTPQDALNTFNKTRIDVLVLGEYIVERNELRDNLHREDASGRLGSSQVHELQET